MASPLIEFYRGTAPDVVGRHVDEIRAWDDERLEEVHNYIQWLFPLPEPSAFNYRAPLLTPDDIAEFQNDPRLRASLRQSFDRFLTFLGLVHDGTTVRDGPNLAARVADVWDGPNHNWLRITRVLRCLSLLGLPTEARALLAWLTAARDQRRFRSLDASFDYWQQAVVDHARPGPEPAGGV